MQRISKSCQDKKYIFENITGISWDNMGHMQWRNQEKKRERRKRHDMLRKIPRREGETEHTKGLLRLRQILELIPISRSAWWAGCKSGRYPKPIKLGPRTAVWKAADIYALLDKLSSSQKEEE